MIRSKPRRGRNKPHPKAVNFFRRHAGYSRRANGAVSSTKRRSALAVALAEAEAEAVARGWRVEWEGDPDAECGAVLRDMDGHAITDRWGLSDLPRDKRRVVEAELALEALGEKR